MPCKYSIYCDGVLIGENANEELPFFSGSLKEAINSAGNLSFTLKYDNPHIPNIKPLRSLIDLYRDGVLIWEGRPTMFMPDVYGNENIYCEGALAFLNDIRMSAVMDSGDYIASVQKVISNTLTTYNNSCTVNRMIREGEMEDGLDQVEIATAETTLEAVSITCFDQLKKIVQQYGGAFYIDFDSYKALHLNYKLKGRLSTQPIIFKKNVVDITRKFDVSNVITSVRVVINSGQATESTNVIVTNDEAVKAFGVIQGICELQSRSTTNRMTKYAKQYLETHMLGDSTFNLTAVDLNLLNDNIERFKVGDVVKVISKEHGIDTYMQLSAVETDLNNPTKSRITLGGTNKTLTKYMTRWV